MKHLFALILMCILPFYQIFSQVIDITDGTVWDISGDKTLIIKCKAQGKQDTASCKLDRNYTVTFKAKVDVSAMENSRETTPETIYSDNTLWIISISSQDTELSQLVRGIIQVNLINNIVDGINFVTGGSVVNENLVLQRMLSYKPQKPKPPVSPKNTKKTKKQEPAKDVQKEDDALLNFDPFDYFFSKLVDIPSKTNNIPY